MNNKKKILVVDDEVKIIEVVKSYFESNEYIIYEAFNGKQAFQLFKEVNPSLVILDLMLPDISGEGICTELRKKSGVPIIMLSAKNSEADILKGFGLGADEYITKPFSPKELVARVAALLRRTESDESLLSDTISINNNDLVIDNLKHEVKRNGSSINLTPGEYKILFTMASNPGKIFTREELITSVLGGKYKHFDRVVDTHIKSIRQKVDGGHQLPQYIETVHGIGYRFRSVIQCQNSIQDSAYHTLS